MTKSTCAYTGIEIPEEEVGGCESGQYCDCCSYSHVEEDSSELIGWIAATLIITAVAILVIFWPGASHV